MQLVLLFMAAGGVFSVVRRVARNDLTLIRALPWCVLWLVVAVVAVNPDSTAGIAQFLGVGRGADVVVYVSLAVLFFLVFRCFIALEKLNRSLTGVVRRHALTERDRKSLSSDL